MNFLNESKALPPGLLLNDFWPLMFVRIHSDLKTPAVTAFVSMLVLFCCLFCPLSVSDLSALLYWILRPEQNSSRVRLCFHFLLMRNLQSKAEGGTLTHGFVLGNSRQEMGIFAFDCKVPCCGGSSW